MYTSHNRTGTLPVTGLALTGTPSAGAPVSGAFAGISRKHAARSLNFSKHAPARSFAGGQNAGLTWVCKRDGREVPFNAEKITDALRKALLAAEPALATPETLVALTENVCTELYAHWNNRHRDAGGITEAGVEKNPELAPTVEDIQDVVERVLIECGLAPTAKAYILYRADRTRTRTMQTRLMKVYDDLTNKSAGECDIKRENANIDGDTAMGTMLKFGSEGAKQYYDMYVLPSQMSRAHKNGDIHVHDLDFYTLTTTCCQIDLIKLFADGFSTGHGYLREPNNIASYSALTCIAIQSNQNDQHGGQSVPNFDYALAEGVRKSYVQLYRQNIVRGIALLGGDGSFDLDPEEITAAVKSYMAKIYDTCAVKPQLDITEYAKAESAHLIKLIKERCGTDEAEASVRAAKIQDFTKKLTAKETDRATFQAMEALVHNLNTMNSRAGAQTPFSSINYGTDTSLEGRMVIKNILLANEAGLGGGETPIFPIHIFKIKDGVNFNDGDPNYDLFKLACRVSSKRLFPNFSFIDAPFNLPFYKQGDYDTEVAYMGCRTRVMANSHDKSRQTVSGRGNLSFTSINLPRLGITAEGDIDKFFKNLDEMLQLCIDQLTHRFKILCGKTVKNFPFLMGQGVWIDSDALSKSDSIAEVLKHGTMSVGFIGLAECLTALTGRHHGESPSSKELGLRIISHMRGRLDEESRATSLNYTLLATPAEGLSGRFAELDRKMFGTIKGVTDREYYTNSFHVPVYYPITACEKIEIEAPYHALTNAGHISYVELDGDTSNNLEAFERVIRYMKECGIGYGSVNHPVDRDPVCGYSGVINEICPACGRAEGNGSPAGNIPFERIRRITGYLVGTTDRFNNAKKAEEHDRVKHSV